MEKKTVGIIGLNEYPRYTYEDYKNWEGKWELIEGIPYAMSPSPGWKHQIISSKIAWQLEELLKECKECKPLLPVDWKISEDTVVQPDNLVICYEPEDKPYLTKAPSLIFEILSKSTALKDREIKFKLYEREGVKYYIIVDPEDRIAKIYKLENGRYIKVCDATNEKVKFELGECKFEFDFFLIFNIGY
ncbi:MAG: Uma2 family endonuclease [Desulfurobacterium sp.]|nr:MAG: Uma2 family endonuclease [Desulfurobacterium sp.]